MNWKAGQVQTTRGLEAAGISRKRASYLKSAGFLASIGDGAFQKVNETPPWSAGVEALEKQLNIDVHVGGRSALAIEGTVQYVMLGKQAPLWLFGHGTPPKWFRDHDWGRAVMFERRRLFTDAVADTLKPKMVDGFTVTISRRERAIMEVIHLIGKHHRFEEIQELFEGLTSIDAEIAQRLLEDCLSIKVRRVFLYLGRESSHTWFSRLDKSKVDIGIGKRVVVKGGQLDPQYHITVPRPAEEPDV